MCPSARTTDSPTAITGRKILFFNGLVYWRRGWDSNPVSPRRISDLQILTCQRCRKCQRCRGALLVFTRRRLTPRVVALQCAAPIVSPRLSACGRTAGLEQAKLTRPVRPAATTIIESNTPRHREGNVRSPTELRNAQRTDRRRHRKSVVSIAAMNAARPLQGGRPDGIY
jgi:hypothetical protein